MLKRIFVLMTLFSLLFAAGEFGLPKEEMDKLTAWLQEGWIKFPHILGMLTLCLVGWLGAELVRGWLRGRAAHKLQKDVERLRTENQRLLLAQVQIGTQKQVADRLSDAAVRLDRLVAAQSLPNGAQDRPGKLKWTGAEPSADWESVLPSEVIDLGAALKRAMYVVKQLCESIEADDAARIDKAWEWLSAALEGLDDEAGRVEEAEAQKEAANPEVSHRLSEIKKRLGELADLNTEIKKLLGHHEKEKAIDWTLRMEQQLRAAGLEIDALREVLGAAPDRCFEQQAKSVVLRDGRAEQFRIVEAVLTELTSQGDILAAKLKADDALGASFFHDQLSSVLDLLDEQIAKLETMLPEVGAPPEAAVFQQSLRTSVKDLQDLDEVIARECRDNRLDIAASRLNAFSRKREQLRQAATKLQAAYAK